MLPFLQEKGIFNTPLPLKLDIKENFSYIPYSGCVLEHILHTSTLTNNEKLFYLLADSLGLINKNKNATKQRSIALSSSTWSEKLNCSKTEVFSLQRSLEEKGYFIVTRDTNKCGKNMRNVLIPTLPDSVFFALSKEPDRFSVDDARIYSDLSNIDLANRRSYLDDTKLFIRFNYQILNIITSSSTLTSFAKIVWLDFYSKCYKNHIKSKSQTDDKHLNDYFAFSCSYQELENSFGCSKVVISKTIKSLEILGFIKRSRFHVKNDDIDDNLHDKSLWNITVTIASEFSSKDSQNIADLKPESYQLEEGDISVCDPYISNSGLLYTKDFILNNNDLDYLDSDSKISADFAESSSLSESLKDSLEELKIDNDNSLDLIQQEISTDSNSLEIRIVKQEDSRAEDNPKATDDQQAVEIAKLDKQPAKSLKSFYPLTKEQVDKLNQLSDREFSVNFANQLLMKLYCRDSNKRFLSKNHMIAYMSKAFHYELHQAPLVNHQSFCFAVNQNQADKDQKAREKYLAEVEYNVDTSYQSQLRRKIASIFEPELAYLLLTKGKFDYHEAEEEQQIDASCSVQLPDKIEFTSNQQQILENAIIAVYGLTIVIYEKFSQSSEKVEENKYLAKNIESSNILAIKKLDQQNNVLQKSVNQNNQALDPNSAWYKIRKELRNQLGEFIDQTWLAGLIAKENLETKTLTLIAPTNFIRDYIQNNYSHKIRQYCMEENIWFDLLVNNIDLR